MSFYIKWKQNCIPKLHSMMTPILMSWFKEKTERRKTNLLKETVENADLHKAVLNKTMTTQELCVIYDFVASLKSIACINANMLHNNLLSASMFIIYINLPRFIRNIRQYTKVKGGVRRQWLSVQSSIFPVFIL